MGQCPENGDQTHMPGGSKYPIWKVSEPLVPKASKIMVVGIRNLKYRVLGPWGIRVVLCTVPQHPGSGPGTDGFSVVMW